AHKIREGEIAIIISYALMPDSLAHDYEPHVVFVDENNAIVC
ncbi:MAG: aspartate 1-decarboxylase, partial [Actinomycetaceae bacterium]|nr:aspartate 1-decarboxylase [Actinomycetaceae bacterium]